MSNFKVGDLVQWWETFKNTHHKPRMMTGTVVSARGEYLGIRGDGEGWLGGRWVRQPSQVSFVSRVEGEIAIEKPIVAPTLPSVVVMDAIGRCLDRLFKVYEGDTMLMPDGLFDDYMAVRAWLDQQPVGHLPIDGWEFAYAPAPEPDPPDPPEDWDEDADDEDKPHYDTPGGW